MAKRAIDVKNAKERLAELADEASRGEDVVLTRNGEPVARIVPIRPAKRARCFGSARGKVVVHQDFDAPLDQFREYI